LFGTIQSQIPFAVFDGALNVTITVVLFEIVELLPAEQFAPKVIV
jgi:hypothetical protein